MRKTSQAIDGFEDRSRHKPRNAGNVSKLERQGNRSPQSLQKNSPANILVLAQSEPCQTSDLQNWKRIIDLCYILKWNLNVFFKLVIRLLIVYFWLRWVFVAAHPLSLAAARGLLLSCGAQAACCGGFPFCGAWRSVRERRWLSYVGSLVVVHELSCSMARGIPPD